MNITFHSQEYFTEQKNTSGTSAPLVSDSDIKKTEQGELLRLLVKIGNDGVNEDNMELIRECIGNVNDAFGSGNLSTKDFIEGGGISAGEIIKKTNNQLIKDRLNVSFAHKNLLNILALNEVKDPEDDAGSYAYFWKGISNSISSIREDYVDFYADLMQSYVEIYQNYNDNYVEAAGRAVSEGKDASHITWTTYKLNDAEDTFEKFFKKKEKELGHVPHWKNLSHAQRINMERTLKPVFDVNQETGEISFNLDFYLNGPSNHPGTKTVSNKSGSDQYSLPEYQAWLAAFNNMGNTFQSNMQTFAQTYSQVNSTFNNLNKVLSSTITAMGESANFVLKSIS